MLLIKKILAFSFLFMAFFSKGQNLHIAWGRQSTGDTSCWQNGRAVAIDPLGYVYVAGSFLGQAISFNTTTLYNTDSASTDIFLVKYDSLGNVIWAKSFGSPGGDGPTAMAIDSSGKILLCGSCSAAPFFFNSDTLAHSGCFVLKLDGFGNSIWALQDSTGAGYNDITAVDVDEHGDVYLTGFCFPMMKLDTVVITSPQSQVCSFVIKINKSGKGQWGVELGTSSMNGVYGYDLCTDKLGHVYACGTFLDVLSVGTYTVYNLAGYYDTYVVEFDYNGDLVRLWHEESSTGDCWANALSCDDKGNLFMAGSFSGNSIQFGGQTLINSLGPMYTTLFLVKYDSLAAVRWARGVNKQSVAQDVCTDKKGNACITGDSYSSNIQFGTYNLTVPFNSPDPMFIAEYDSVGTVLYAHLFPTGRNDNRVSADMFGNVYVASDFNMASPFKIANDTLRSVSHRNFFLVRLSNDPAAGVNAHTMETGEIDLFPNPTNGIVTITAKSQISAISIFNTLGQIVYEVHEIKGGQLIDLSGLTSGIYTVRFFETGRGSSVIKVIKENN